MKTLFLTVAATALIFAAPAALGADDHHHGDHPDGGHPGGAPAMHAAPAVPAHTAAPAAAPAMTMSHSTHHGAAMNAPLTPQNSPYANGRLDHKGHGNNNTKGNAFDGNARNFNNDHRGRDRNGSHGAINFNRHNVTASHHYRYRGGRYRWPGGYHYQRWSFGMTLPSIFWGRDYWISDYEDYGLAYPPPGCIWVRYGSDAILIDQYTGEILEVVYGQFY